ncbi:MAG: hypothetical protein HC892_20495 [Saprospiraceae bacterium]|nr:hypothetical protein [Saprospiraceae bacterium]
MEEGKELLEGFNAGYLMEKHRPELSKQVVKATEGVDTPFFEGFVAGSQEFDKERSRSKVISKLKDFSSPKKDNPTKRKGQGFGNGYLKSIREVWYKSFSSFKISCCLTSEKHSSHVVNFKPLDNYSFAIKVIGKP